MMIACGTADTRPKSSNAGGTIAAAPLAAATTEMVETLGSKTMAALVLERSGRANWVRNSFEGGRACGAQERGGGTTTDITGRGIAEPMD